MAALLLLADEQENMAAVNLEWGTRSVLVDYGKSECAVREEGTLERKNLEAVREWQRKG